MLTMDGAIIDNGVVVVDNGLIAYAGKDTGEKADRVLDAKGCAVMPGIINAHTHLSMTVLRGCADGLPCEDWIKKIQPEEAKLTPPDIRAGAHLGMLEMIKSGTTSFADMYIHMDEVARAVEETGMRAALGYGMIEGLNEDTDSKLRSRERFAREWNGKADGRIKTMYAPHSAASCSKEFLIRVKELAARDRSRIHIHVLETEHELQLMKKRYGMCSVNLLNSIDLLGPDTLAAHCIWLSDDDIEILSKNNANVIHCPASNMNLGAGVAPVPKMLGRGINVALGTDGAASAGSLDMWKEMRAALYLHRLKDPRSMPASKVLEMATANGARALGIKAGVLKPGYLADIIVVDLKKPQFISSDPISALIYGATAGYVRTTIVNGEVLMEDHRVTKLDEDKIMDDASRVMQRIAGNN